MIWALVLAAGESKRMGEPKQLLPFGRSTVIETVVQSVISSSVDKTLVVLGAARDRVEAVLKKFEVELTVNPDFAAGMLSSVQWGIRHLPQTARAALVFLADQPWVSAETANLVIDEYRRTGKGLVLPTHAGSDGHPLLVDLGKYRAEIDRLSPQVGLRQLLSLHPEDISRFEVEDPNISRDLDTPGDYEASASRKKS
jgi:molybdenum cofactor cytidylyltransferase